MPLLLPGLLAITLGSCGGGTALPPANPPALPTSRLPGAGVQIDTMAFGRFGPVVLYRARARPSRVVLFVSGDGGWNHGVVAMARSLASLDALVVSPG
jgi:hypothetical protein